MERTWEIERALSVRGVLVLVFAIVEFWGDRNGIARRQEKVKTNGK